MLLQNLNRKQAHVKLGNWPPTDLTTTYSITLLRNLFVHQLIMDQCGWNERSHLIQLGQCARFSLHGLLLATNIFLENIRKYIPKLRLVFFFPGLSKAYKLIKKC